MPLTPLARPSRINVGLQENVSLGTETTLPGLDPSVDWMETTFVASSTFMAVLVMMLSAG